MSEEANEPEEQALAQNIVQLTIVLPEKPAKAGFPVTGDERIYEVAETLATFPSTKAYTSFNLNYNGKILPSNATISEVISSGSSNSAPTGKSSEYPELTLTMSDAPYTERKARDHVIKVREMAALEIPSFQEGMHNFSGVAAGASTYESLALDEVKEKEEEKEEKEEEKKEEKKEEVENKPTISEKERKDIDQELEKVLNVHPDASEFAASSSLKLKPALNTLSVSAWTPAAQSRQLQGDLFYLLCQTLEGETYHITANVKGFFVNKSSANRFDGHERLVAAGNGKSSHKKSKAHSLVTLLKSLSSKFGEQLEANRNVVQNNATETFVIPSNCYLANPWLVKKGEEPRADLGRSQYSYLHYDLKGDTVTDWNQQFQDLRDLPQSSLQEAINKDEVLNNLTFEFTTAAVQGAIATIKGDIAPMNPEEPEKNHIFLKNGIFYSFPTDLTKEFAKSGGDEAARVAAARDLASVRLLNKMNIPGITYLMTTIVDYCGHRVVCQTPAPGIFTKVPEESEAANSDSAFPEIIKHGVVGQGKVLLTDAGIQKKMEAVADEFHLKTHKVWIGTGKDTSEFNTYSRTKGVKGTDGRDYMIDLYRTTPLDIEFIDKYYDPSKKDSYPFGEVTLRHEAVDEWWRRQASVAVRKEAERLEREKKDEDTDETKEAEKQTIAVDPKLFSLNPDAFSLSEAPTKELEAEQKKDEDEVREASKFVQNVLIPEFLEEFEKTDTFLPLDGAHLASIMHDQGINMRYLGVITRLIDERIEKISKEKEERAAKIAKDNVVIAAELEKEEKEVTEEMKKVMQTKKGDEARKEIAKLQEKQQKKEEERQKKQSTDISSSDAAYSLRTVKRICIEEAVSRSTKHYLRQALSKTPLVFAPYVISHVHNCLLTPSGGPEVQAAKIDPELKELYDLDEVAPVLKKSAQDVLSEIAEIAHTRFRLELSEGWATKLHPLVVMSNIARKFGIQWKSREYAFTAEKLEKQISAAKEAVGEAKAQAESQDALKKSRKSKKKNGKKHHHHDQHATSVSEAEIQTSVFVPEDIIGLVPIIKDAPYESTTATNIWTAAVENSQSSKKQAETLQLFQEALATFEQIYGSIHPLTASAVSDLSRVLSKLDQASGAVGLQRKAFQITERIWGVDSYRAVLALNRMALYETENGQYADALKIYRRALNHWLVSYGDESHPTVLSTLSSIAVILQNLKLNEEASKVFQKAIDVSDRTHGVDADVSGLLHFQLAQTLIAQNKSAEAAAECEKAYEIFKPVLGLNNVFTSQARNWSRGLRNYMAEAKIRQEYAKKMSMQKEKEERKEKEGKKEKEGRKLKQKEKRKKNQAEDSNPEIAQKSVDEIMKYINSGSASEKSEKHHS